MERPTQSLTARQSAVLEFIADHIQDTGFPPTIREIGDHMGISSTNGVNDHLKAIERKGYLTREDSKSRAIRPLFMPDGGPFEQWAGDTDPETPFEDIHQIPVVGRIAAGMPIAAIENIEDQVSLGESLIGRPKDVFGLRVHGDSMIEDGIFDGDYIFVKKQDDARDGEIVAAMVDGEATVKRLFREGGRVRLQPANSAMEPIYVSAEEARQTAILGKVVAVFRKI